MLDLIIPALIGYGIGIVIMTVVNFYVFSYMYEHGDEL